jgi:hypothetical protein
MMPSDCVSSTHFSTMSKKELLRMAFRFLCAFWLVGIAVSGGILARLSQWDELLEGERAWVAFDAIYVAVMTVVTPLFWWLSRRMQDDEDDNDKRP